LRGPELCRLRRYARAFAAAWAAAAVFAGLAGAAMADARYDRFVKSFWPTAKRAGISRATYDSAFAGLTPDPEVIEKDAYQPEFILSASYYLALTVTDTRIRIGKEKLAQHEEALDAIEKRYGVDRHVLVAIWGMETNFGQFMGDKNIIRALSTLAYTGRRKKFGRTQLLAALKMLERGYITPDKIMGSWAGAAGYTQLIPSNYLKFAVDFDGDGKRDVWETPADALASTANYLARAGWTPGHTWGYEVVLPGRVGIGYAGRRRSRSLKRWMALGVKRVKDQEFPRPGDRAYLYLPAGRKGPTFLLLDNFRVIMRYNAAHKYAMAVAHLSDRLRGLGPFERPWPDGVRALEEAERFELQKLLVALGYEIGKVDGVLGSKTRAAIREFQKKNKMKPNDGFPTPKVLEALRAEAPAPQAEKQPETPAETSPAESAEPQDKKPAQ
jgi:membrane-bound lytic murein transglycosylase B